MVTRSRPAVMVTAAAVAEPPAAAAAPRAFHCAGEDASRGAIRAGIRGICPSCRDHRIDGFPAALQALATLSTGACNISNKPQFGAESRRSGYRSETFGPFRA